MKSLIAASIVVVLAACAPTQTLMQGRQNFSSGQIGCAPEEIGIQATGTATWTATCRGKVFYCVGDPNPSCKAKLEG